MAARRKSGLRVAIVGAGKVGTVLGRVLAEEGVRVTAVVSRTRASARAAAAYMHCPVYADSPGAIPPETGIVFITTPHDAVGVVARDLARLQGLDFKKMSFCHASGMLTAAVLAPLEERGAAVFSFHPLQTFPRNFPPRAMAASARGIWYGVDGSPGALRVARRLARALCGRVLEVPPGSRELYHAACVVASNHVNALLAVLGEMSSAVTGGGTHALEPFRPIIETTIRNVFATSPGAALSGPVARGGVGTVARHLEAVRGSVPALLPYFTRMTLETVRLAAEGGSLGPAPRKALEDLVLSFMPDVQNQGNTQ